MESRLWSSGNAVMNIPSLCIHLDRKSEFDPNKETHLKPILATKIIDHLVGSSKKAGDEYPDIYNVQKKNYMSFLERIADDLKIDIG